MLGLGNGRRGMKSPPLLVAVLLACVLVLGINYWISSSRSIELQSRVMELEGRMRRAAAERGAVEIKKNEFEEQLASQKGQIEEIQSLHMTQLESFNTRCSNEKAVLLKNLTFKDQLLAKLQGEMKDLTRNYGVLQQEMDLFRESQARKLSFELEQCSNKMKEISDQCEERLKKINMNGAENAVAVKNEGQAKPALPKESEAQKSGIVQQNINEQEEKDNTVNNIIPRPTNAKEQDVPAKEEQGEKKNAGILESEKIASDMRKLIPEAQVPSQNPSKASKAVNNLPAEPGKVQDPFEEEDKLEGVEEEEQPGDQQSKKEINNEEVEREQLLNLDDQEDKDMAQDEIDQANQDVDTENEDAKLTDYNGEEGNEPEPEAKKQAELAGNEIILKGPMDNENAMNDRNDQELARRKEDREQRLK